MHAGEVEVERKDGAKERVPFGTCIWATGIAMHPLVANLQAMLPPEVQNSRRCETGAVGCLWLVL